MSKPSVFINKVFGKTNIVKRENLAYNFTHKFKIVVFVPADNADELTFAMSFAGAGEIGNYTACSFRSEGVGTFIGNKNSKPYLGQAGKFEKADEVRLEMICSIENLNNAIDKMYEVHPYEEPAYEIYKVMVRDRNPDDRIVKVILKKPLLLKSIFGKLNNLIETGNLIRFKNTTVKEAIIDFSGEERSFNFAAKGSKKILYITKNSNRTFKIQMV